MSKSKSKAKKIQELLVKHLLDCGTIELRLPDNMVLEIDITKDGKHGVEIADDYCYVKASREGNSTTIDTYNVGLEYNEDDKTMICVDTSFDTEGRRVKRLEIV